MNSFLLAAANATPNQLGVGLIVIGSFMGFLIMGIVLWKHLVPSEKKPSQVTLTPSPLHVELVKTLATKEELESLERDIKAGFERIEVKLQAEREAARVALGKAHGRIDKFAENTSEIKGELKQLNASMRMLLERQLKI